MPSTEAISRPRSKATKWILVALCLGGLLLAVVVWLLHPRESELSVSPSFTGSYRGLGLHPGAGWLGRQWFHVRVDEGAEGWWEVTFSGFGYAPYRGYYASGKLKEEGVCLVEENGTTGEPLPDRHQILDGRYYDPAGKLASTVSQGTGRQLLLYADGKKYWDLELRDGHRVELRMYWPIGKLLSYERYDADDRREGPAYSDHASGSPRLRGHYTQGRRSGVWRRFFDDGSVETIEDYNQDPPVTLKFARGQKRLSQQEMSELEKEFASVNGEP